MNISPVSAGSNAIQTSSSNNAIKLLEKQKAELQEQIQKVRESKLDDKTKQERVKQLQEQIQQIDAEIRQRLSEMRQQKQDNNQQERSNKTDNDGGDSSNDAAMLFLTQAGSAYSKAKVVKNTRDSLERKGNILRTEIKLDEGRGGASESKRSELQKIESTTQALDEKVGETLGAVHKQVKKAAKEGSEEENVDGKRKNSEEDTKQNGAAAGNTGYTSVDIRV